LITSHTTKDAAIVVKMIVNGEFKLKFWLGMILTGNILPLFLLSFSWLEWMKNLEAITLPLAGILVIVGLWFAEDIWVKAPQKIPLS
jgi:hypothetical protein